MSELDIKKALDFQLNVTNKDGPAPTKEYSAFLYYSIVFSAIMTFCVLTIYVLSKRYENK